MVIYGTVIDRLNFPGDNIGKELTTLKWLASDKLLHSKLGLMLYCDNIDSQDLCREVTVCKPSSLWRKASGFDNQHWISDFWNMFSVPSLRPCPCARDRRLPELWTGFLLLDCHYEFWFVSQLNQFMNSTTKTNKLTIYSLSLLSKFVCWFVFVMWCCFSKLRPYFFWMRVFNARC